MTFLSNLLCCFDVKDNERREHSITSHHPKLTKTQSNIQRALHTNNSKNANSQSQSQNQQQQLNNQHTVSDANQVPKPSVTHTSIATTNNHNGNTTTPSTNNNKNHSTTGNNTTTTNSNNNATDLNSSGQAQQNNQNTIKPIQVSNESMDMDGLESDQITKAQIHEYTRTAKDSTDSSKEEEATVSDQHSQQQQQQQQQQQKQQHHNRDDVITSTVTADDDDGDIADEEEDEGLYQDGEMADADEDEQYDLDLRRIQTGQAVAESGFLLNPQPKSLKGRKCLVLDLDETLVHSSFKYVRHSDFVIPVEIENQLHNVYVIKRPGVDEFLKKCGELFEVVVFTASVARYGDPLLDILDSCKNVHHRLFRESCYNYQGNYIKNLSQMGRPLSDLIIIDNSPASYIFHPEHSVPISSWFSDTHDCELPDLLPFLEDLANKNVDDVGLVLDVNLYP
ncbi:unnamed protein product [Ambrosiozyma monospora]|uniref:Unnamed protein product n=1 Tax=Ambrosiozyma monospora TaxID=43982 RepID=A0A9W7DHT0_AMBMO|nr:unnamed protein product [Ambrosiozyma monospora]